MLDSFDPLEYRPGEPADLAAHARNIVKNVLDSYTGRFDLLAEAVQNSFDAIEARWGKGLVGADGRRDGELPTIRVVLDASQDRNDVSVTDNGQGIHESRLQEVFTPHLSPKLLSEKPTRGHKGVGTTFLIYGHPAFEVESKVVGEDATAFRIVGGSNWARSRGDVSPPRFERIEPVGDHLGGFGAGTRVTVQVDESTRFGRLRNAQYNRLETWELVLRTFTAIGHVAVAAPAHRLPEWLSNLRIELVLKGVSGGGSKVVEPTFRYPHLDVQSATSLSKLWSGQVQPNDRFEMLYLELGRDALEQALQAQIEALENSEVPEDQEILQAFRSYDTEVYASWAYKNTLYEDIYRNAISEPAAKRQQYMNVRNGLQVVSVGMPVGVVTDHPYSKMKPEYRRRLFMMVSFNEKYSPDLGRKTIPAQDQPFLEWLERHVQNLFLKHVSRLERDNDEVPHKSGSFSEAKEDLAQEAERLRRKASAQGRLSAELSFMTVPLYEAELVGLFYSLLASGQLQGYRLLAIPGSRTRFDGFFDFSTARFDGVVSTDAVPLGIAESKAKAGSFSRLGKWLEFKVKLEDLIENFDAEDGAASKKYAELVDLLVVWEVPEEESIGNYDLTALDLTNWNQREYHGVTHLLRRAGSDHVIQVLAVQHFLRLNATAL